MDTRSQWRLFTLRSGEALPAADHGPGLWFSSRQRRGAIAQLVVTAELDQAHDRRAQDQPGLRARVVDIRSAHKPCGPRLYARIQRRDPALRRQSFSFSTIGGARPVALEWLD